jgi:HEAT repeat protein
MTPSSRAGPPEAPRVPARVRSVLGRAAGLSLDAVPAVLEFLREAGIEQLKELPVLRGFVVAGEKLVEAEETRRIERKIDHVLDCGVQSAGGLESLREDVRLLAELTIAIFRAQRELGRWLAANQPSVGLAEATEFAALAALAAYRARVVIDHLYADHRGVASAAQEGHVVSLPLADVYVSPWLVPERPRDAARTREREIVAMLDQPAVEDLAAGDRARLQEEYAELTGRRWQPSGAVPGDGRSPGEVLAAHRRLVVLGGPGVGKSVLIRHLARVSALGGDEMLAALGWVEGLTPVVVSLAAYGRARRADPDLTLHAHIGALMSERGGEALRAAIDRELREGAALLLLDGVDEEPDLGMRAAIVRAVDAFLRDHERCRCVVTSRPYGYIRLAGDLPHFHLPNFSAEQVEAFVVGWHRAFERWQHPEAPDLDRADADARALRDEIRRSPRIAELAANPLMLVIVALIRFEQLRLPERRVQFYDRAVTTHMHTWNVWRASANANVGGLSLPYDRLVRVWGAVAEWARRGRITGVIHRHDLKRQLVAVLERYELDDEDPEATAESYLNAAAHRAGLLEERGPNVFAFWHPTFEEFLAAVDLATPTGSCVHRLLPLRDDPWWREVILLALGYVGVVQHDPETATEAVRAVMEDGPAIAVEPIVHPRLRLSAACVADDVGVKRHLADTIVARLAAVVLEQPYEPLTAAFVATVRAVPRLRATPDTVGAMAALAGHSEWDVRMEAARLLANVADTSDRARDACGALLEDRYPDVRCHAALGLARSGRFTDAVWLALSRYDSAHAHLGTAVEDFLTAAPDDAIASLVALLRRGRPETRRAAVKLLVAARRDDERAVAALTATLAVNDPGPRFEAARLLCELGRADERTVAALTATLGVNDATLRRRAARLLGDLGRSDERVVAALRARLAMNDPRLRYQAARLLCELGRTDDGVVAVLIGTLANAASGSWQEAAQLLLDRGRTDQRVADALTGAVAGDDPWLRYQAAKLLCELGRADDRVLAALVLTLAADASGLRSQAAALLGQVGRTDGRVVAMLTDTLATEDSRLRFEAASLLAELGRAGEPVTAALRASVQASDPRLRYEAARLLCELGRADEGVVATLGSALAAGAPELSYQAARLLGELGRTDERVAAVLAATMTAGPRRLRFQAARLLTELGRTDEPVMAALGAAMSVEDDPWLRYQAARLLSELGRTDERVVAALTATLSVDDTRLWGPAATLLTRLGRNDERVVTALTAALDADDPWLRYEAAKLLSELERTDERVVTALTATLDQDDPRLRYEAARLLGELGRTDERVVAALTATLTLDDPVLRNRAATLLNELGHGGGGAIDVAIESVVAGSPNSRIALSRLPEPLKQRFVRTAVERLRAEPWAELAAWQRILRSEALRPDDGQVLADLTRLRPDDPEAVRRTRACLFGWLLEYLEPQAA